MSDEKQTGLLERVWKTAQTDLQVLIHTLEQHFA
jgi:hypothetical protein